MNNNSSKQILLSVIGVAILVIAVVGVSFAFFTYTRTSATDNVITTGSLTFAFADSKFITLTDHFPVDTAAQVTGAHSECVFTVEGKASAGTTISYDVYAEKGSTSGTVGAKDQTVNIDGKTAFENEEISMYVTATPASATNNSYTIKTYTDAEGVALTDEIENGIQIATGTMTGSNEGENHKVTYTVKMWVDSDVVSIGDAETDDYTTDEYADKYYTMKIRVTARDAQTQQAQ